MFDDIKNENVGVCLKASEGSEPTAEQWLRTTSLMRLSQSVLSLEVSDVENERPTMHTWLLRLMDQVACVSHAHGLDLAENIADLEAFQHALSVGLETEEVTVQQAAEADSRVKSSYFELMKDAFQSPAGTTLLEPLRKALQRLQTDAVGDTRFKDAFSL